jgi:hypothetical protein
VRSAASRRTELARSRLWPSFETRARARSLHETSASGAGQPLSLGGKRLDLDGITEFFKALYQVLGVRDLGTAVEMVGTEILIDSSVFEHVVEGGEDGGGDGTDRFLRPAAAAQAQVLSLVVASLFVFGCVGTLNDGRLKPLRTFAKSVRSALPGALVVARAHASPGQQMSRGGKAAHVGANFGDDGLGAELADAGMGAHDFDGDAKGREIGFDLAVHHAERGIETIDLLQMELQQEAMMTRRPSAQMPPPAWLAATSRWDAPTLRAELDRSRPPPWH